MNTVHDTSKKHDKLNDPEGPCSSAFEELGKCAKNNHVKRYLDELRVCPDQTANLISCIKKHPLYHYTRKNTGDN
jgi:hypothetical protein